MIRAYVGLGANLGNSAAALTRAIHGLADITGARLAGVSRLYATKPVGFADQPEFMNAVVALDIEPASADPGEAATGLLVELKRLERAGGRTPRQRWGPREIDLDLLAFGRHRISVDVPPEGRSIDFALKGVRLLEVPHPSARERLFVLAPWADLAAGLVPPGWGETVATVRRRQEGVEGSEAVRPIAEWDADAADWRISERPLRRSRARRRRAAGARRSRTEVRE